MRRQRRQVSGLEPNIHNLYNPQNLFRFPISIPSMTSTLLPDHALAILKLCDAKDSYTLCWWSMLCCTHATPNARYQRHDASANEHHPSHPQPWRDVASTSRCKCKGTLTSPQPWRYVESTSRCKCKGTLTSPHPPHKKPWRYVASTSRCKCKGRLTSPLTSPHPPHPQPWRDAASTSWCNCKWTSTSPHPPHPQHWRDVASTSWCNCKWTLASCRWLDTW